MVASEASRRRWKDTNNTLNTNSTLNTKSLTLTLLTPPTALTSAKLLPGVLVRRVMRK